MSFLAQHLSQLRNRFKLSWRFWLIFGYALIVIIFCGVWSWSLFGPFNDAAIDQQADSLTAIAQAGVLTVSDTDTDLATIANELVAQTDLRVTIIASDGTVLADSSDAAATMSNHATRPEVAEALAGEIGQDIRVSATDGTERLYIAVLADRDGETIVLRVSSPTSDIESIAASARNSGIILLVVGVVLAVLIAWRTFASASHPVSKMERVRSDFVANASHELKTPVAGIRLLAEAITSASEDGDVETTRIFSTRLNDEATRLQHLVTDLLDLSRLESTDRKANAEVRTDIHSAVTTSLESRRTAAKVKGLELIFEDGIPTGTICRAKMEASDASLIIDNLLDNAIRYTDKGAVTIRLDCDQNEIELIVSDTGVGVPLADQSRIFERFYRVDAARSREMGGTGLGLSLVRHAVERGGGTVEVASILGEGTSFTVRLPRAK